MFGSLVKFSRAVMPFFVAKRDCEIQYSSNLKWILYLSNLLIFPYHAELSKRTVLWNVVVCSWVRSLPFSSIFLSASARTKNHLNNTLRRFTASKENMNVLKIKNNIVKYCCCLTDFIWHNIFWFFFSRNSLVISKRYQQLYWLFT